ncbi:hypothetical protein [Burkholderia pyrrocinia]|uniref:hypothetical protein n=1 Tax=Burkholderia pyrrocinia TaxID=60550 RepID=UPI001BD0C9F8|nr:hypothetical protein [Burkholderia pyrrocinia]QVN18965.1 hypothetical protein JYG32_04295 [Burkholderia pyrrocinia]
MSARWIFTQNWWVERRAWPDRRDDDQSSGMDRLFAEFGAMYGNRWYRDFPDAQAVENWSRTWAEAFEDEQVTPGTVLRDALAACRKRYDWPPSLTEFLALCKPAIDIDAALYEAIEQLRARRGGRDVWTNPAIYYAAVRLGEHDMLQLSFSQLKPRFEAALCAVLASGNVPPVPTRQVALVAPGRSETARERGREASGQLRALLASMRFAVGDVQWAYDFLLRGTGRNGEPLTAEIRQNAIDVVQSRPGRVFLMSASPEVRARYAPVVALLESEVAA